jgi:hypothetical protein
MTITSAMKWASALIQGRSLPPYTDGYRSLRDGMGVAFVPGIDARRIRPPGA